MKKRVRIRARLDTVGPCFCFLAWISDLSNWCACSSVSSSNLTAQPNPPKIHEGWWAYKEVVQGSFVPGKPQNCMQHFDACRFPTAYWFFCIHFNHTVFLMLNRELITYLRLHGATLPVAMVSFFHSYKTSSPFPHKWHLSLVDWLAHSSVPPFPSCCVSACRANYFPEIVFFCWAEVLLIKPAGGCVYECVYLR